MTVTNDRLREIAAREYGPNRQEWEAMAEELLALRRTVAMLAPYADDVSVASHFPDLAGALRVAVAAGSPSNWSPAVGDIVEDVRHGIEGTIVRKQPGPLPWVVARADGTETGYAAHEIQRPTGGDRG